MTVRMAAMVGCDGGKPSARAATGDHDQRCRIPPPAGSQGCRPVIEPGPSGGRSGCFADVGLALITLGGRASLAVQAKPRQEPVAEGREARAATSAEQARAAAQVRPVNFRDESGTVLNQTGAVAEEGALAAAQHCVPAWTGDAALDEGVPPPTGAIAVPASAAGRSSAGEDPDVEISERDAPSSLRRGTAGMAGTTTGRSPAPVRLTVARLKARNPWSSREYRSGWGRAVSSSASSSNSARDSGRPKSAMGDANGLRQKPTPWQSGQAQSSQKSPPPTAILQRPRSISFREPLSDFVWIAAQLLGDLTLGPILRVEADGEAPEAGRRLRLRVPPAQPDVPCQCRHACGHAYPAHHADTWLPVGARMTRTSWRSGRVSQTGHNPSVIRSIAMAISAVGVRDPFSYPEICAFDRSPSRLATADCGHPIDFRQSDNRITAVVHTV
ncbi:hypothetical protein ABIC32_002413 [Brevundimonas sp. 1080]